MSVFVVTRLRLRSPRYLAPFLWHAVRSFRQAEAAPGNLFSSTRRIGLSFWTLTGWKSEEELAHYLRAGAHGRAMPKLAGWCDEAATARWSDEAERVDWEEGESRLRVEGRLHRVDRPSAAQSAGEPLGS